MSQKTAVPLCLPNNIKWCERTGNCTELWDVKRESLYVVEAARRQLRAIKGPVCVVAIAGPCRQGKSYILSKVFGQGNVFPLGHSFDPETMGIWMWIVPEKYKDENGQDITVVLLDSEGIDAVTFQGANDHRIFTLTVLLSSVLIYNSAGVPRRNDLELLDFIASLSEKIHCSTASNPGLTSAQNKEQFCRTFPHFIWLLRDVVLDLPRGCATLKDYFLSRVFNSCIDDNSRAQRVVESILQLFKGFDAFMLPSPVVDPVVIKSLNDPAYEAAISRKFISGIEEFSRVVHEKLNPRTSNNDAEYVTGEALAVLLDQHVNTLNTPGAVPNVPLVWQTFIQEKYSQAMMNVGKLNEQGIAEIRSKVPCKAGIIQDQLYQVFETCLQLFHSEMQGIYVKSTDEHLNLIVKINESLSELLKENEQATRRECEELLQKLRQDILDPVLERLSGPEGAKLSYQDIMQSYSALETAYKQQAKGAEDTCAAVMAKCRTQLQVIVQNYTHLLKKLKDSDVRITEEKEAKARQEALNKCQAGEKEWLQNKLQRREKENPVSSTAKTSTKTENQESPQDSTASNSGLEAARASPVFADSAPGPRFSSPQSNTDDTAVVTFVPSPLFSPISSRHFSFASSGYYSLGYESFTSPLSLPEKTRRDLMFLLDPEHPQADWRHLAERLGCEPKHIRWLEYRKDSPTLSLLNLLEILPSPMMSIGQMAEVLKDLGRVDAAEVVEGALSRELESLRESDV